MLIGAMNHPAHPVVAEIDWMAEMGLDFIDLTLEPPAAGYWQIDVAAIRQALRERGLGIVGHTAYYLPLGHPFEPVRRGAVDCFVRSAEVFAELGADRMNIHPDAKAPLHPPGFVIERNRQSLEEILAQVRPLGVRLMIENLPGEFKTLEQLGALLDPLPELGLHLDVGHTHLAGSAPLAAMVEAWGARLLHVHLHDNLGGGADLHLPLGAGTLDLKGALGTLKRSGYDGTITLEVFSPDRDYLRYSLVKLKEMWQEV
ncbi:MAG: sugar phosphate isomerase/epimerase [Desulfuromonadales bacterium]|nr:sugar phosphate isomerase/epimerase [Desulfuromonadales bacterium]